jgi:hypothetical protein
MKDRYNTPKLPEETGIIPYLGGDYSVSDTLIYPELFIAIIKAPGRVDKQRVAYESRDLTHSISLLKMLTENGWEVPVASHLFLNGEKVRIETFNYLFNFES